MLCILALSLLCGFVGFQGFKKMAVSYSQGSTENVRALLPKMDPHKSQTLLVSPCSIPQFKTLPEPLPLNEVLWAPKANALPVGKTVWVAWSHMGVSECKEWLALLQSKAESWEVTATGLDRGLVLAKFK